MLVGALGVGLGFGLQNITSNFFSGLILLFEHPIEIGDRVEIAGCVGEVTEIAARATTLVTDENVAILVPNSQFVSERVTNWSGQQAHRLCRLSLRFPQLGPGAGAAGAARRRGQAPGRPAESAPEVEFVEVGLGALRFQLQVWSNEHLKTAGALRSELNFEVWRQLAAAGVTIGSGHGPMTLGLHLVPSSPG